MKKFQIVSILLLVTWTGNALGMEPAPGKPAKAPATHNLKGEVTSYGRQQGLENLSPDQMNGIRALKKFQSSKEYQKNPSKYNDVVNETHIANGTENVVFAKKPTKSTQDITFDVDAAPEKNVAVNTKANSIPAKNQFSPEIATLIESSNLSPETLKTLNNITNKEIMTPEDFKNITTGMQTTKRFHTQYRTDNMTLTSIRENGEIFQSSDPLSPLNNPKPDITFDSAAAPEKNVANNVDINNSNRPSDSPIQYTKTPSNGYSKKITIPDSEIQKIIEKNKDLLSIDDQKIINNKDFDLENGLIKCYDANFYSNYKKIILDTNGTVLYSSDPASFKNIIDKIEANNPHVLTEQDVRAMQQGQIEKTGDIITYTYGGDRIGVEINGTTGKIIFNHGKNGQSRLYNPKQEIKLNVDAAPEKNMEVNAKENAVNKNQFTQEKLTITENNLRKTNNEILNFSKNLVKDSANISPEVADIINNAKDIDQMNHELTELLMTTNNPEIANNISNFAQQLDGNNQINKNIIEFIHLSANKDATIQVIGDHIDYPTVKIQVDLLQKFKTDELQYATEKNFSKNYKDNLAKIYDNAIAKLQKKQQSRVNSDAQSLALSKNLVKNSENISPEVADIINNAKDIDQMTQKLTDLIMKSDDLKISHNISNLTRQLQQQENYINNQNIQELGNLANSKNINIQQVIGNNVNYPTIASKISKIQEWKQYDENYNNNRSTSDTLKKNTTKLYDDALKQLQEQQTTYEQKINDIVGKDSTHSHNSQINALNNRITSLPLDQNITPQTRNMIQSNYKNALEKVQNRTKKDIARNDIQALNNKSKIAFENFRTTNDLQYLTTYISNSFSVLAKRGTLGKEMIKSTISSLFKSSGIKDPQGKVAEQTTNNAMKNQPKTPNDPVATANWIQRWLVQPVSDFISYASGKNKVSKEVDSASAEVQSEKNETANSTTSDAQNPSLSSAEQTAQAKINKTISYSIGNKGKINTLKTQYKVIQERQSNMPSLEFDNITKMYSDAIVNLGGEPLS